VDIRAWAESFRDRMDKAFIDCSDSRDILFVVDNNGNIIVRAYIPTID
jgi:hypothetical protein